MTSFLKFLCFLFVLCSIASIHFITICLFIVRLRLFSCVNTSNTYRLTTLYGNTNTCRWLTTSFYIMQAWVWHWQGTNSGGVIKITQCYYHLGINIRIPHSVHLHSTNLVQTFQFYFLNPLPSLFCFFNLFFQSAWSYVYGWAPLVGPRSLRTPSLLNQVTYNDMRL